MRRRGARCRLLVRYSALAVLAVAPLLPAYAQHARSIAGRVLLQRGRTAQPVAGSLVTLHRVGSDSSGAIDSVPSGGKGEYAFTFRPFGAEEALYFAAVVYGGVAYFTPPLGAAPLKGESADIVLFDTTSAGIALSVRGRHVAVSAPSASGVRSVVDVFELANDSLRTLVAAAGRPVWGIALPDEVRNAAVMPGAGDVAREAVHIAEGRATVSAPFAPGIKQLALRYELSANHGGLTIPAIQATDVFEVLLEEPNATASGVGLVPRGSVNAEGRDLQRFLAQNVPAGGVVRITFPARAAERGVPVWLLAAFGAALAGIVAVSLLRLARAQRRQRAARAAGERT